MTTAPERLSRLLALVSYVTSHQGVPLREAADHFDITEAQLISDLQLLFVCGTPGHLPDDLIDAQWESGRVYLDNAQVIARPLRFAVDEAVSLIAGLQALVEGVGAEAARSALSKLTDATADVAPVLGAVRVDLGESDPAVLAEVRTGLEQHRVLDLEYLVASRDETTTRSVEPLGLEAVGGQWYLRAWCRHADGMRTFRLDRVRRVTATEQAFDPAVRAGQDEPLAERVFRASPDDQVVRLHLEASAEWVAEYYPCESRRVLPDGSLQLVLSTPDAGWVSRLVLLLGSQVRSVQPAQVAASAVAMARSALADYT